MGFVKKTRAIKLKIQERQMTSTSLLISPEFDLERELTTTLLFCLLTLKLKHKNLIVCRHVKEEIKQ